jgi:DNA-binding transcriptional MerR regulator
MTIKEIAELCGVEPHTIRNWANREDFLRENFTLRNSVLEEIDE